VNGADGDDSLQGNTGDDFLDGGSGTDTADGGADNDICTASEASNVDCESISPQSGFLIQKTSSYSSAGGSFVIVGEVRNVTPYNASSVEVSAILYDANGSVLASDSSYACVDVVGRLQTSPFEIRVFEALPAPVDHYLLQAAGTATNTPVIDGLVVSGQNAYLDEFGYYHVVGQATNQSSRTYDGVGACVAFYDVQGTVVRTAFDYLDPSTLAPHQPGGFDASEAVDVVPASYSLRFGGYPN
jgi:hypothetical protein